MKSPKLPLPASAVSSRTSPCMVGMTLIGLAALFVPFTAIHSIRNRPHPGDSPWLTKPSSIPPDYVVDMARERARDPSHLFVVSQSDSLIAKNHPAFQTIPEQYRPKPDWKQTHFPDINILGMPKAGTSHLYHVIVSHPQVTAFNEHKEFHFNLDSKTMYEFSTKTSHDNHDIEMMLDAMHKANNNTSGWIIPQDDQKQTVNGLLDPRLTLLQFQYLQPSTNGKYIILLRDPADWVWSGYNFWIHPEHEDVLPATVEDWASKPAHYRSPELFHEYMRAGERSWVGNDLLGKFRDACRATLALLLNFTSKENILILKSEDFDPKIVRGTGVIQKLAAFLNVSEDLFDKQTVYSYGNCGDLKGENNTCNKATNAYAITGKRPMFEETRDLVYLHFAEECKFWAEQFDVRFERCLDVRKRYIDDFPRKTDVQEIPNRRK